MNHSKYKQDKIPFWVFVTVNRNPYAFMKAKVSTVILILTVPHVFFALGDVDLDMYTFIVYL